MKRESDRLDALFEGARCADPPDAPWLGAKVTARLRAERPAGIGQLAWRFGPGMALAFGVLFFWLAAGLPLDVSGLAAGFVSGETEMLSYLIGGEL